MGTSKVKLRTLEAGDLDYLYRWENDPEVWQYGDCGAEVPHSSGMRSLIRFTREELKKFIENQQYGLEANGQLRLVICRHDTPIGFIDLFDYDSTELTASIGILICNPSDRHKGYGRKALSLALDHAHRELGLRVITCTINPDNHASETLFAGAGFQLIDNNFLTHWQKKLLTFAKSKRPSPLPPA